MTWQERRLPHDDQELWFEWLLRGENYAALARHYGCHESSVRKRIRMIQARLEVGTKPGVRFAG